MDPSYENYPDKYYGIGFQIISQPIQFFLSEIILKFQNIDSYGAHLLAKHFVVFIFFFISGIFVFLIISIWPLLDEKELRYWSLIVSIIFYIMNEDKQLILENYNKIKKINKSKNLVIGFGITIKTISSLKKADGLVVGSALCKEISESIKKKQNPVTKVGNMVKRLRTKLS